LSLVFSCACNVNEARRSRVMIILIKKIKSLPKKISNNSSFEKEYLDDFL